MSAVGYECHAKMMSRLVDDCQCERKCTRTVIFFLNDVRDREIRELSVWLNEPELRREKSPRFLGGDLGRGTHLPGTHGRGGVDGSRWSMIVAIPDWCDWGWCKELLRKTYVV